MDRWVTDKWMKEWIKRWVCGWIRMNGWEEGCMEGYPAAWVAWQTGEQMDGCEGRWINF